VVCYRQTQCNQEILGKMSCDVLVGNCMPAPTWGQACAHCTFSKYPAQDVNVPSKKCVP
jgi:hypothetical protein